MQFKHRIELLKNQTESAIEAANWQMQRSIFANVNQLCDNKFISLENINFGDVISEEYYLFRIRFTEQVTSDMRIKFNDKIFEIKRIINKNFANKILLIIALEI